MIQAKESVTGLLDVDASAPGFGATASNIPVVAPGVRLRSLVGSIDIPDPDDSFIAELGVPKIDGSTLDRIQKTRFGGPGYTATFSVVPVTVAELVTSGSSGQTVQAVIVEGTSSTPSSVNLGGVALAPLTEGTATVSVTVPGFQSLDDTTQDVVVGPAIITFGSLPLDVGSGLISRWATVNLNGTAHGGVTVRVESLDPAKMLISSDENEVGQGFVDLVINDGLNNKRFYLHGIEGMTGGVILTATATRWAGDTNAAQVATPAFELNSVPASIDVLDPNSVFTIRLGTANGTSSALGQLQALRPGSAGLTATVISSDFAIVQLVTSSTVNDTVLVDAVAGEFQTPWGIPLGGMELDGVGEGSATIYAEIPGFVPVAAAIQTVEVTQPGMTAFYWRSTVGAGLRTSWGGVKLGASAHGGVTAHVEVADSTLVLLSTHPDSLGHGSIDMFSMPMLHSWCAREWPMRRRIHWPKSRRSGLGERRWWRPYRSTPSGWLILSLRPASPIRRWSLFRSEPSKAVVMWRPVVWLLIHAFPVW